MSASDRDKSSEGHKFSSRKCLYVGPESSPVRARRADVFVEEDQIFRNCFHKYLIILYLTQNNRQYLFLPPPLSLSLQYNQKIYLI